MADDELLKRVMPNDIKAEQSVLGAMFIDNEVIGPVVELLTGEDFYYKQNGAVFDAIAALFRENRAVDPVTVLDRMKENGVPEEVRSEDLIKDIISSVYSSVNAQQYARIVYEKSTLRRLIRTSEEIASDCYAQSGKLDDILDDTEKKIFNLVQSRNTKEFMPIADIVTDVLRKIEEASRTKGHITGLATGFADLDYKTAGLQPSDFILVAARPSMGKTAFVLTIADYVTVKRKESVAIFSLEMSADQLVNRMLAMESQIDAQNLRSGDLSDRDWEALMESSEAIGTSRLIIDDTPGIKVADIRSKCRKYKLEQDIKLIIIDYIQLMSGSGSRSDNRQQEVSDISRGLKSLARELNVPIIVLSQLNRAVEARADHRPMLADIRESGAIEQDADVIMFLYRDDYYNEDSPEKNIAEVIIAKQRNGPTGTIKLGWQAKYTRFVNLEKNDAGGRY